MTCKLCQKHGKAGPWVSGTNNFRSKTVKKHLNCNAHKDSVATEKPCQRTLTRTFTENQQKRMNSIIAALRTVYWIATEEVASRKYPSLLKLQRLQGVQEIKNLRVGGNATYDSPDIFNQLLAAINSIIEIEIREKLKRTSYPGSFLYTKTRRKDPGCGWSRVTQILRDKLKFDLGRSGRGALCHKGKFSEYKYHIFNIFLLIFLELCFIHAPILNDRSLVI